MSLQANFEAAKEKSATLPSKPANDVLLKMYALYKQGSSGDVSGERPGGFDFVGAAKYDAWAGLSGKSQEEAMQEYIDFIDSLF